MIIIGLTGSIGMGKSTAATMLQSLGVPVHDSDAAVHDFLRPGGDAQSALRAVFPVLRYAGIYQWGGGVNRKALGQLVFKNSDARAKLEAILHPLVRKDQEEFLRAQHAAGRQMVALDIPLLFETGAQEGVDYTVVVTAPSFVQQERVLSRPGMSVKKFQSILQSQMPNAEKCARADYLLHSGLGRAYMMKKLKEVLCDIRHRTALPDARFI